MVLSILSDFDAYPSAFVWNGPVTSFVLAGWQSGGVDRVVPKDLLYLWEAVGGGDVFESETIFEPGATPPAEDIDAENKRLRSVGLPEGLLVFHTGLCVSAVDQLTMDIVQLAPGSFGERSRFESLDDWYRTLLRAEYGARYGFS